MQDTRIVQSDSVYRAEQDRYKNLYTGMLLNEYKLSGSSVSGMSDDQILNSPGFIQFAQGRLNSVAGLDHGGLKDMVMFDQNMVMLEGKQHFKKKETGFIEPPSFRQGLTRVKTELFDQIDRLAQMPSKQTGSSLIARARDLDGVLNYTYNRNRVGGSISSLRTAYDNFAKASQFMTYDTETLSGIGESGYRTLDALTEFSFDIWNKDNVSAPAERIANVVGISPKEADVIKGELEQIRKTGQTPSERARVMLGRLAMYGDPNTQVRQVQGGKLGDYEVMFAPKGDYSLDRKVDMAFRGLDELQKVWTVQDANRNSAGLSRPEEQLLDAVTRMRSMPLYGKNDTRFDVKVMNQSLASDKFSQAFKDMLIASDSLNQGPVPSFNINKTLHTDVESLLRNYTSVVGKNQLFQGDFAALEEGLTQHTLEAIGKKFYPHLYQGGRAHEAGTDSAVLAHIIGHKLDGGQTLYDRMMSQIKAQQMPGMSAKIRGGNTQLFIPTQSMSFNSYDRTGALNAVYDTASKQWRTFGGYAVDATDNVTKNDLNFPIGLSRNDPFTIEYITELNTTQDWINLMRGEGGDPGMIPEYAQGKLIAAKFNPVYDKSVTKDIHSGLQSPRIHFFSSMEELEGVISNSIYAADADLTYMGDRFGDGGAGWVTREEAKQLMMPTRIVQKGDVVVREAAIADAENNANTWIRNTSRDRVNESSARGIREASYSKAVQFFDFYRDVSRVTGKERPELDDVKSYLYSLYGSEGANLDLSRKLSELVAKGEPLTVKLQELMGTAITGQEDKKLLRETIDQRIFNFGFLADEADLQRSVIDMVNGHKINGRALNGGEKDFYYKFLMREAREKIAGFMPQDQREALYSSYEADPVIRAAETNFMEVMLPDSYFEGVTKLEDAPFSSADRTMRVSLDPGNKEYDLLDRIFRMRYRNKGLPSRDGEQGRHELIRFMDALDSQERYRGAFDGIVRRNNYGDMELDSQYAKVKAPIIAADVQRRLAQFAQDNPDKQYLNPLKRQSVINGSQIGRTFSGDSNIRSSVLGSLRSTLANAPEYTRIENNLDKGALGTYIDDLIDSVVFSDYKNLSAEGLMRQYGYDQDQARYMMMHAQNLRRDAKQWYTDFVQGVTGAGLGFQYDRKRKEINIIDGDNTTTLHNAFKVRADGGRMYIQTGNSRIAAHSVIDFSDVTRSKSFTASKVGFGTNLGMASRSHSPSWMMRRGAERGNAMSQALSVIKTMSEELYKSPSVPVGNISDIKSMFYVDFNSMVQALPYMRDAFQGSWLQDPNFMEIMNPVFQNGIPGSPDAFKNLPDHIRQALGKNIMPMLSYIASNSDNDQLRFVVQGLSSLVKESYISEGVVSFGRQSVYAGGQMDASKRPPMDQTVRNISYDRRQWEQAIKDNPELANVINLNPLFTTLEQEKLYGRSIDGVDSATMLRTKFLATSELSNKQLILDEFEKGAQGAFKDIADGEKVLDVLKGTNLYEQEAIIDARIAQNFFFKTDMQEIKAAKNIELAFELANATNQEMFDRSRVQHKFSIDKGGRISFNYGTGVLVNEGDTLVRSGDGTLGAKYEGLFRFGYFTKEEGHLLSEGDITRRIQSIKAGNANISEVEIQKRLEQEFDAKYYLMRMTPGGYAKMSVGGAEKAMAYAPMFGLGDYDQRIARGMASAGYGKYLGTFAPDAFIEDFMLKNEGFVKEFGSVEAARKAVYAERFLPSDIYFRGVLREHGINVGFVSDLASKKHSNIQSVVESALAMIQDRSTDAEFNSLFRRVVKVQGVDYKNGRIIVPREYRGGQDFYDIEELAKIAKEKDLGKYAGQLIADGAFKGVVGSANIWQTNDHPGGTHVAPIDADLILQKKKLEAALRGGGLSGDALTESQAALGRIREQMRNKGAIQRGLKITDRGLINLEQQRFNSTFIENLRRNTSAQEFEDVIGYALDRDANGNYSIKKDFKGRAVLGDYTDQLRRLVFQGDDESERVSAVADRLASADPGRYGFLRDYASNGLGDLNYHTAEKLHSVRLGMDAMKYNANPDIHGGLVGGFKPVSIGDMPLAFGDSARTVLDNENNPYTNSLLIDLGEHSGLKRRYVASPQAPVRMNGDELAPYDFQEALRRMQYWNSELRTFESGGQSQYESKDDIISGMNRAIDSFDQALQGDITSKGSIFKSIYDVRSQRSYTGETSSMLYLDGQRMGLSDGALSRALFKGRSLAEHASEGRYVDAIFLSQEAFEKMGMFRMDYMKQALGDGLDSEDAYRNAMINQLKTIGDAGLVTRFPQIQEGSDLATIAYLDDKLKGSRMKIMGWTQKALGNDNDSDKVMYMSSYSSDISLQRAIRTNSHYYRNHMAFMHSRAVGVNRGFYAKSLNDALLGDVEKAVGNMDLESFFGDRAIGGKVFAEFSKMDFAAMQGVARRANPIQEAAAQAAGADRGAAYFKAAMDHIQGLQEDDSQKAMLRDVFARAEMFKVYNESIANKMRKLTIGNINTPGFTARRIGDIMYGSEETSSKRMVLQEVWHAMEQEVISAKKSTDAVRIDKAKVLVDSINGVLRANDGTERRGHADAIKQWIMNSDLSRFGEKVDFLQVADPDFAKSVQNITDQSKRVEHLANQFVDFTSQMNTPQVQGLRYYLSMGESIAGVNARNVSEALVDVDGGNSLTQQTMRYLSQGEGINLREISMRGNTDLGAAQITQRSARQGLEAVVRSTSEMFAQGGGGGLGSALAVGALGLAGSFMVAGFVGGNPARPAETQAQEDAENDYYTVPSLLDGASSVQGRQQPGYVININARTAKGKQHATQAIQTALSNSMTTNINVSMNINENNGNITDRDIERMLAGALR